jgi:hypothetical protein
MRATLGAAIVIGSICLGYAPLAENRCACPKVSAFGVGDSSCSASESDNKCAVDFNIFGQERESRAVDLLRSTTIGGLSIPDPSLNSVDVFGKARPNDVPDYVLIYMTVALGDRVALDQVSKDTATRFLQNLNRFRAELDPQIVEMFTRQSPAIPLNPSSVDLRTVEQQIGEARAILSPGCIEVASTEMWVMFKTVWSQARLAPRCGRVR